MINWGATGRARIAQNARNLLALSRYELPYARTLGLDPALIDRPGMEGAAIAAIYELVEGAEPRASIRNVAIVRDAQGNVQPEVTLDFE